MGRIFLALAVLAGVAGCGSTISLHAPVCTSAATRAAPVPVEVEPIVARPDATSGTQVALAPPGPAAVLTSAIRNELAARALSGGEPGGYVVRCTLERFAVRFHTAIAGTSQVSTLFADLSCEADRAADRAHVWRGAIRGRAAAGKAGFLSDDVAMAQTLTLRTMSDAAREMASDIAVRALGLGTLPSTRVFTDEAERVVNAGTDDTPLGPVALSESPERVRGILSARFEHDATTRAAAWNALAMASGPGDEWLGGKEPLTPDEDAMVRFYQYKALGRAASPASLAELRAAKLREGEGWLSEVIDDTLASAGIGLARPANATSATSGATTRP